MEQQNDTPNAGVIKKRWNKTTIAVIKHSKLLQLLRPFAHRMRVKRCLRSALRNYPAYLKGKCKTIRAFCSILDSVIIL